VPHPVVIGDALERVGLIEPYLVPQAEIRNLVTPAQLDADGLADDADYEMHEDYIVWHPWTAVADKIKKSITFLEETVKWTRVT
jgi:hypothetical protein